MRQRLEVKLGAPFSIDAVFPDGNETVNKNKYDGIHIDHLQKPGILKEVSQSYKYYRQGQYIACGGGIEHKGPIKVTDNRKKAVFFKPTKVYNDKQEPVNGKLHHPE